MNRQGWSKEDRLQAFGRAEIKNARFTGGKQYLRILEKIR